MRLQPTRRSERATVEAGGDGMRPADPGLGENELLTIGEAAMQLGVTPAGVRALERRGQLTAIRTVGNHRRYRLPDVVRLGQRKRLKTNRHQRIPSFEEMERRKPRSRRHGGRDIRTEEVA